MSLTIKGCPLWPSSSRDPTSRDAQAKKQLKHSDTVDKNYPRPQRIRCRSRDRNNYSTGGSQLRVTIQGNADYPEVS